MNTTITIRRTASNVIEYDVATQEPWEKSPNVHTFHANRTATFHGKHSGGSAMQVNGAASTLWRDTDSEMIEAFKRAYKGAEITVS